MGGGLLVVEKIPPEKMVISGAWISVGAPLTMSPGMTWFFQVELSGRREEEELIFNGLKMLSRYTS